MRIRRALVTTAMTVASVLVVPSTADAAAYSASFGQHVRACAQTMGFSGTHNPGMHQGAAGWNGMTCG